MSSPRRSLKDVLLAAQRAGILGARPINEVIEHSRQFTAAISDDARSVIDIGSGAGIPGLVIASEREDLELTLVDRRATRMDSLTRAVESMGLSSRVRVITADAETLAMDATHAGAYDAAVCRGLGSPEYTAKLARPFLREGGVLIVSEPPHLEENRWPDEMISARGFVNARRLGGVAVLVARPGRPSSTS